VATHQSAKYSAFYYDPLQFLINVEIKYLRRDDTMSSDQLIQMELPTKLWKIVKESALSKLIEG